MHDEELYENDDLKNFMRQEPLQQAFASLLFKYEQRNKNTPAYIYTSFIVTFIKHCLKARM